MDGLTDITVSSVHTSDLSSFEEDTEEEVVMSESMEEGEITSDGKVMPLGSFLLSLTDTQDFPSPKTAWSSGLTGAWEFVVGSFVFKSQLTYLL